MQSLAELLHQNSEKSCEIGSLEWNKLRNECLQAQADVYNASVEDGDGYECDECKNKRYIASVRNGEMVLRQCRCVKARTSLYNARNSGLGELLDKCTFSSYAATQTWQERIREKALNYSTNPFGWFYIGGSVGSGKTHICTAMVGEMLKVGKSAKYFVWRDEIVRIKASVNDEAAYAKLVNAAKNTDVLYIDDFFKAGAAPTAADVNVAFEIINYRYNINSITIFSSEKSIDEIMEIDMATGSRIYEKSLNNYIYLSGDKNQRMV